MMMMMKMFKTFMISIFDQHALFITLQNLIKLIESFQGIFRLFMWIVPMLGLDRCEDVPLLCPRPNRTQPVVGLPKHKCDTCMSACRQCLGGLQQGYFNILVVLLKLILMSRYLELNNTSSLQGLVRGNFVGQI